jgi:hypothetical protein
MNALPENPGCRRAASWPGCGAGSGFIVYGDLIVLKVVFLKVVLKASDLVNGLNHKSGLEAVNQFPP